jgi:hypothetical protein
MPETLIDLRADALKQAHEFVFSGDRGRMRLSAVEEAVGGSKVRLEVIPGKQPSPFVNAGRSIAVLGKTKEIAHGRSRDEETIADGATVEWYDFEIKPESIDRLTILASPSEYAEFRNVSLRRGKISAVKVVPLRAAGRDARPATQPG